MSPTLRCSGLAAAALAFALGPLVGEASAQSTSCGELQGHLQKRKSIAESLGAGGKKQIDAKVACSGFNQLVANGNTLIKWTETNKDWCQIPDTFIESIKADHGKAQAIRAKACGVAAKQIEMEKKGASGGGGGGLLGGGGLSGSTAMPQGAL